LMAKINDLFNEAARDLPEGYRIEIMIEKDSGWVDLIKPDNTRIDMVCADWCLETSIKEAISMAMADKKP